MNLTEWVKANYTSRAIMAQATLLGVFAIGCWASTPTIILHLHPLPSFEILMLSQGISVVLIGTKLLLCRQWHRLRQAPTAWGIGFVGIVGCYTTYVLALGLAPAPQVAIISYSWPLLAVLMSVGIYHEAFRVRTLLAATIGLLGVAIVLSNEQASQQAVVNYWWGYGLALLSALCWSSYCSFASRAQHPHSEVIVGYLALGALLHATVHGLQEQFVIPSPEQWAWLLLLGSTVFGVAFLCWDHAIKHGHYRIVCVLSYFTPILSIVLLHQFALAELTLPFVAWCDAGGRQRLVSGWRITMGSLSMCC